MEMRDEIITERLCANQGTTTEIQGRVKDFTVDSLEHTRGAKTREGEMSKRQDDKRGRRTKHNHTL